DLLDRRGYKTTTAINVSSALSALAACNPQVVLIDVRLGRESGVDLLEKIMTQQPKLTCVMITAHADIETAVSAMSRGAYDYYEKSSDPGELYAILNRAFER